MDYYDEEDDPIGHSFDPWGWPYHPKTPSWGRTIVVTVTCLTIVFLYCAAVVYFFPDITP